MNKISIILIFLFTISCAIPEGYEIKPSSDRGSAMAGCCCAELDGDGYEFNLWVCENYPYRRGACLPMRKNQCTKKHKYSHRHRHRH